MEREGRSAEGPWSNAEPDLVVVVYEAASGTVLHVHLETRGRAPSEDSPEERAIALAREGLAEGGPGLEAVRVSPETLRDLRGQVLRVDVARRTLASPGREGSP